MGDFSEEIRHASVKNWLIFCDSLLDLKIPLHYRSQESKLLSTDITVMVPTTAEDCFGDTHLDNPNRPFSTIPDDLAEVG